MPTREIVAWVLVALAVVMVVAMQIPQTYALMSKEQAELNYLNATREYAIEYMRALFQQRPMNPEIVQHAKEATYNYAAYLTPEEIAEIMNRLKNDSGTE